MRLAGFEAILDRKRLLAHLDGFRVAFQLLLVGGVAHQVFLPHHQKTIISFSSNQTPKAVDIINAGKMMSIKTKKFLVVHADIFPAEAVFNILNCFFHFQIVNQERKTLINVAGNQSLSYKYISGV